MKFINTPYDGLKTIEIKITNSNVYRYYFPVIEDLNRKIIRRIDIIYRNTVVTPENRTILASTRIPFAFLNLVSYNRITKQQYPLYFIWNTVGQYCMAREEINYKIPDWENSYVEFSNDVTLSTSESIVFIIYYQDRVYSIFRSRPRYLLNKLYRFLLGYEQINIYPLTAKVTDTSKRLFYFPDDEKLTLAKVKKIEVFDNGLISPLHETIISSESILCKSCLTLKNKKNKIIIDKLPLLFLFKNQTLYSEILFNNLDIDWPKSYIETANTTGLTLNTVYYLSIYF